MGCFAGNSSETCTAEQSCTINIADLDMILSHKSFNINTLNNILHKAINQKQPENNQGKSSNTRRYSTERNCHILIFLHGYINGMDKFESKAFNNWFLKK